MGFTSRKEFIKCGFFSKHGKEKQIGFGFDF